MAESPPDSYTPASASLIESTRPHEDSMEEFDSQATRKRPRLDSGSQAHQSLSIDAYTSPTAPAPEMDLTPDSVRPSKVTINVKSPNVDMPAEKTEQLPENPQTPDRLSTASQPPTPNTNPHNSDATYQKPISISSSPTQSPEIEVADLEDIDDDPSNSGSGWHRIEDTLRAEKMEPEIVDDDDDDDATALAYSFPRFFEPDSPRDNLIGVIALIKDYDDMDPNIMTAVKTWMDHCFRNIDRLTIETFSTYPEFWEELPDMVEHVLRRERLLPMDDGQGLWICLEEFFMDYTKIAMRLVEIDTLCLTNLADAPEIKTQDSLSRKFLLNLAWLSQKTAIPFYRVLEQAYGDELIDLLTRMKLQALDMNVPRELAEYASCLAENAVKCPHWVEDLNPVVQALVNFMDDPLDYRHSLQEEPTPTMPLGSDLLTLFRDTIQYIDATYQEAITKKASWLTKEMSENFLRQLFRGWTIVGQRDSAFANLMSEAMSIQLPDFANPAAELQISCWEWKFRTLKKQIMEGRMELRVLGVETMQSELVNVWKQHCNSSVSTSTSLLIEHLTRFILDNKIVDYLVGIDSHPQLVYRSHNILGFLIMTTRYQNEEIDTIWKTVTENQDSSIVSEVLSMLNKIAVYFNSGASQLVHTCSKLLELPLDRFDARVMDLCDTLLNRMSDKYSSEQAARGYIHPTALQVCVRLIRESTAAKNISAEQKKHLQIFGTKHLEAFVYVGIDEADRMEMYERCIHDIAEMNEFTAGSLQVLNALVPKNSVHEMKKLAEDFDLARLVVNDILHTVKRDNVDLDDGFSQHSLIPRVSILLRIIDMVPDTITPELGRAFWTEILLSDKLGPVGHRAAWKMMVSALSRSSTSNPFLERCIHDYLPELSPTDYTPQLLAFAKQSISYDVRVNPPQLVTEDEIISIPGMDRIWNFILTAPPNTIEEEATKFAIDVYLDHQILRSSPRPAIAATHIAIVNRCIDQLKSTATTLKISSDTVSSEDVPMKTEVPAQIGADELKFTRSLLFLRQFLSGLRARPHYFPPKNPPLKGDPVEVSWQFFNAGVPSTITQLEIGDLSTAAELAEKLIQLTGFSKLTMFWGGQRVDLLEEPDALLRDTIRPGLLLIHKAQDAELISRDTNTPNQTLTAVDIEVLKHFDEIYDLLSLKDELASEIFDFLTVFPPQQRILDLVRSEDKDELDLFPLDKPFVTLLSINALQTALHDEEVKMTSNQSFSSHTIGVLVAFLMNDELTRSVTHEGIRLVLAGKAMHCLLTAIFVYRAGDESSSLFKVADSFAGCLLSLLASVQSLDVTYQNAVHAHELICCAFAVLVEGSTRDDSFWEAVKQRDQFHSLTQKLLLEEYRQPIRTEVADRIRMICNPPKPIKGPASLGLQQRSPEQINESPVRLDMITTIWNTLVQTIPHIPQHYTQCAEFFTAAIWLFRRVAERSPECLLLNQYLKDWSAIMFSHQPEQFVGRETVDDLILGIGVLLEICLERAKLANVELDTYDLAGQILDVFLFPALSEDPGSGDKSQIITPRIPILHSGTRRTLYNVVGLLCQRSEESMGQFLKQMDEAIPRDMSYGPDSCFDRSKMLRAPGGYPGLRNLSNTCYLNSLMTQLFMNVEFRDFMLGLELENSNEPSRPQKLLDETQRLFAWMQNTWMKSLDTTSFVESIRISEKPIDVNVQMDVGEFCDHLFPLWEAQIRDPVKKKKFQSFYGGQLVQQIKSKECSHISERLDTFSAIQCDIKGKAGLEESLQAYVEGEMLQGDNKYSCTACGRFVDAVKRTCLKDVPDSLIFHLKRFDFDMLEMERRKINDEFQFPERIDMTPYKVEHLSNPEEPVEPDIFELVGVTIHTGTEEQGHYYSYTRERPSAGDDASWVEFNDADVSRFDPAAIADQCFGGPTGARIGSSNNKVWSAYMLFYQRVSTMNASKQLYRPLKEYCPVQVPLRPELANHIAMDNEILIRTYCFLDPSYTSLVHGVLENLRTAPPGYANRSQYEVIAMNIGMDTLEQIAARSLNHYGADDIFLELKELLGRNPHTALQTLRWISSRETSLPNILLRNSDDDFRKKAIWLILDSLNRVQVSLKDPNLDLDYRNGLQFQTNEYVGNIARFLEQMWVDIRGWPRAWDHYFDCFLQLAECGPEMVGTLLSNSTFLRCLEFIWLDREDRMGIRNSYCDSYGEYMKLVEKARRRPSTSAMELCSFFFQNIDFSANNVPTWQPRRPLPNGKFPLSIPEGNYIRQLDGNASGFLLKMLQHPTFGVQPACFEIFATMVSAEPEAQFLHCIVETLKIGLRLAPADLCGPFLTAAFIFCKNAPDETLIAHLIEFIADGASFVGNEGGTVHLEFFQQLCSPDAVNERLALVPEWFQGAVKQNIPLFAPTLLLDREKSVRQGALEIANKLLFSADNGEDMFNEPHSEHTIIGRRLGNACVNKVKNILLTDPAIEIPSIRVYSLTSTAVHCMENYFNPENESDRLTTQIANDKLEALEQRTVHVTEDLVSESDAPSAEEWEATSALASDSEMGLVGSP